MSALLVAIVLLGLFVASPANGETPRNLQREQLVPWCIVPFDAKQRTPAERAEMLKELGLTRCAYDWRQQHVPTFETEILEYRKRGIEFFAFWGVHDEAFRLFEKYDLHPQIWQMVAGVQGNTDDEKLAWTVKTLTPLAERTAAMGCKLGLYNHGGWAGEPANMVAVCKRMRELGHKHVGIVYNFHHGHDHVPDWANSLAAMKPYLLCLNLNGMNPKAEPKILGIGKGKYEKEMIAEVIRSGYDGPIGILNHREQLDAREGLLENIDGLARLLKELDESSATSGKHHGHHDHDHPAKTPPQGEPSPSHQGGIPYDPALVERLIAESRQQGDALRGAAVFAAAKSACLSCHRVGSQGGNVGPELTNVGKDREIKHLVESVFWPQRDVKREYTLWRIATTDGRLLSGFRTHREDGQITLRELTSGKTIELRQDEIDDMVASGTPMPDGLAAALGRQQQLDLIRFLSELGRHEQTMLESIERVLAEAQSHGPATFSFAADPLVPDRWPNANHPVNRQRVYDFYTKQANYFRTHPGPSLLVPFPGLDGEQAGHWGIQNEQSWVDDRWNSVRLGSLQAGIFRSDKQTTTRGVCLRLGEHGQLSACFNPETLAYDAIWTGGFVKFSSVRHGFMDGLRRDGNLVIQADPSLVLRPGFAGDAPITYRGFYRHGPRVVFAYRIGDVEYLDAPWADGATFHREVGPLETHRLKHVTAGGPRQWPGEFETAIHLGDQRPYAIDTIELPTDDPWNIPLFCSAHAFLSDGSALVCTMHGDVWRVTNFEASIETTSEQPRKARWQRFASGLFHPLGIVVENDEIYVQCRDQITRLHDLNGDGEADFYECFSRAFVTSPAGHDYICGLERDTEGAFYTASGNQGLVRISPDGKQADVLATGFRNPDGLGHLPDGTVTVPCSEGEWTPASMICAVRPQSRHADGHTSNAPPPHFGYKGPQNGQPPELPLAYVPRGLDNSSGGQTYVTSDRWGPLQGQLLHFSFGACTHFVVLRDEVQGQLQGAIVPLPGDFLSGVHRGRFHPRDGQLYVTGMNGWGSYASQDGCFQRVRYTGDPVQLPVAFHVHENGVLVKFSQPLDREFAENVAHHFAQTWNYRYSAAYGSPEFATTHPGVRGHDRLNIASAHVLADGHSLFLELPDLQPVNQLHLQIGVSPGEHRELFVTVHRLDRPFQDFPGYRQAPKTIAVHPLLADLALAANRQPNPFAKAIGGARDITIETGKNLTFATNELRAKPGEPIRFTLVNPDVVPHNWALLKPGTLQSIGEQANRLITDPEALARHYIPKSDDVLAYTDIVLPGEQFTIYFHAPKQPGRYPFLCTFPGHWQVMNGTLVVE